ncbi:MAG: hypothetical protein KIS96_14550 [Bauldia sp.]|nr:hypothetical protein [Bauldia sp.]
MPRKVDIGYTGTVDVEVTYVIDADRVAVRIKGVAAPIQLRLDQLNDLRPPPKQKPLFDRPD